MDVQWLLEAALPSITEQQVVSGGSGFALPRYLLQS